VIEEPNGDLLAHVCIAWVPIQIGATTLKAGYLEDVATRADARSRGLGSAVVVAAQSVIEAQADIGILATAPGGFTSASAGWSGPARPRSSRPDGSLTPTVEEDGYIMALLLAPTPEAASIDLPITRPRRDPEEAW
jgi:aminoglycoside 2'-N-acetyltransferase I